jgi:hypothetical protein
MGVGEVNEGGNVVDGLHICIYIRNRMKKPLASTLSGAGRGAAEWGDSGGSLTNVQCKSI